MQRFALHAASCVSSLSISITVVVMVLRWIVCAVRCSVRVRLDVRYASRFWYTSTTTLGNFHLVGLFFEKQPQHSQENRNVRNCSTRTKIKQCPIRQRTCGSKQQRLHATQPQTRESSQPKMEQSCETHVHARKARLTWPKMFSQGLNSGEYLGSRRMATPAAVSTALSRGMMWAAV